MNRRTFVKKTTQLSATAISLHKQLLTHPVKSPKPQKIRVTATCSNFEREMLKRPFGFKGGYLTELWQTVVRLSADDAHCVGLATQSVLYGDSNLFARYSEAGGNALMYSLTERALDLVKTVSFQDPIELQELIMPELLDQGRSLTGMRELNSNFVFNALVAIDNAAWTLYANTHKFSSFEQMLPAPYQSPLSSRSKKVAVMYQIPYAMPAQEILQAADSGYFVFKIKTGQPGSQAEMLAKDQARLTQVHSLLKDRRSEQTSDGKLLYTLDSNARYENKQTLRQLLDHARKIGAFDQIIFVEEPLAEDNSEYVGDLGVRMAADESVHTEQDAIRRIEQGYNTLVIKAIAKTLSTSLKIAKVAHDKNIPCICADLTVNPILVDWNKNFAARLAHFPGLGMGLLETNGDMNYVNWEKMKQYHPFHNSPWTFVKNGVFDLDQDYYAHSGGILSIPDHYAALVK